MKRRLSLTPLVLMVALLMIVVAPKLAQGQGREATPIPLTTAYSGEPNPNSLAESAPFASNYSGVGADRAPVYSRLFSRLDAPITEIRPRPKDNRVYGEIKIPVPSRPFALFADFGYRTDSSSDGWLDTEFGAKLPVVSRIYSDFEKQRVDVLSAYVRAVVPLGPKTARKLDYEATLFGVSYSHQRINFSSGLPMGLGLNASLEVGGAWKVESPAGGASKSMEFRYMIELFGVAAGPILRLGIQGRLRHDGVEESLGALYCGVDIPCWNFVMLVSRWIVPFQRFGAFDGAYQGFVTGQQMFTLGVNVAFAP